MEKTRIIRRFPEPATDMAAVHVEPVRVDLKEFSR
jgi:hypothetical protein